MGVGERTPEMNSEIEKDLCAEGAVWWLRNNVESHRLESDLEQVPSPAQATVSSCVTP